MCTVMYMHMYNGAYVRTVIHTYIHTYTNMRFRRFGHVQRQDKAEAMRMILQLTVDGKQKWRLTKTEMARPGERGYGQKQYDNRDGRIQKTLACHDSNQNSTKCRSETKIHYIFIII